MLKSHLYIFATIAFTVYGLFAIKIQMAQLGSLPEGALDKIVFLTKMMVLNPWVLSGIVAGYCAGLCWMMAMTRFALSYAYPFTSLNYVLVLLLSVPIMGEAVNSYRVVGSLLIVAGILVAAKGM